MKVKLSEVVFGLPIFGREYAFIVTCDQNDKQRINTQYHSFKQSQETLGRCMAEMIDEIRIRRNGD